MKKLLLFLVALMLAGSASAVGIWENDMTLDPVGNGWVVRAGSTSSHSISGGVMTVDAATRLDQTPDDPFYKTEIDLIWRGTSVDTHALRGAGLWFNTGVDGVNTQYGYVRMFAALDGNGGQVFKLSDSTGLLASHTFGTGMLTLDADVDYAAASITYSVTDGTTSTGILTQSYNTGVTVVANTSPWITMLGWANTGEIDYIKVNSVVPEPATMALLGLGGLLLRRKK